MTVYRVCCCYTRRHFNRNARTVGSEAREPRSGHIFQSTWEAKPPEQRRERREDEDDREDENEEEDEDDPYGTECQDKTSPSAYDPLSRRRPLPVGMCGVVFPGVQAPDVAGS